MSYSAKVVLRRSYRKDGSCPLYLRILINRKKKDIALGTFVLPDQFKNGKVVAHDQKIDYNLIIGQALARANGIFVDFRLRRKNLTINLFEKEYKNPQARQDFLGFYENRLYEDLHEQDITTRTFKKHELHLRKLKEYAETAEGLDGTIYFFDLTPKLVRNFDHWHARQLKKWAKNKNITLTRDGQAARNGALKSFRKYIRAAQKDGIQFDNPFNLCVLAKVKLQSKDLPRKNSKGFLIWPP